AKEFGAQTQIQGEVRSDFPIVLREDGIVVVAIRVIENAACAKTGLRSTDQEVLKVCGGRAEGANQGVREEQFAIEDLREQLIEIDAGVFAAETENVLAFDPADGVDELEIVLVLRLVGERCGAKLKTGAIEDEFVDGGGDAVSG